MLHNDAVRLAKISVEKLRKVALILSHILHYRNHMSITSWMVFADNGLYGVAYKQHKIVLQKHCSQSTTKVVLKAWL